MEEEKLIEALKKLRKDEYKPWRYIIFTFLNGVAYGLGMTLGMTIVLGMIVYILVLLLTRLVNFPIIGQYFDQIIKLIDVYTKQIPKLR